MSPFDKTINLSPFQKKLYQLFPGLKNQFISWFGIDRCDSVMVDHILFPRNNHFMDDKFLLNLSAGSVEKPEIDLCKTHLKAGSRIVEIGSGLGVAATIVNKAKTPEFHICFEVNPLARDYCKELCELNQLAITIEGKALGSGAKTTFYLCEDYVRSSFTKPAAHIPHVAMEVETTSVANILETYKPNMLICDIEGAEADYIKPEELSGIQAVMIELHPKIYGSEIYDDMIARFTAAGFKIREKREDCVFFEKQAGVSPAK